LSNFCLQNKTAAANG